MPEKEHPSLDLLLKEFRSTFGDQELQNVLAKKLRSSKSQKRVLTIVCDEGMHPIPNAAIVGEKFVFSKSPLNIESAHTLQSDLEERVMALSILLQERSWSRIRIVYTGHAILGSLIKHTVYRITHKETEDLVYFGSAGYFQIKFDMRAILTEKRVSKRSSAMP